MKEAMIATRHETGSATRTRGDVAQLSRRIAGDEVAVLICDRRRRYGSLC